MPAILISVAVLSGLGILFAILLSYASRVFHVKVDRRIEAVRQELPGANCGACGFPGCDGLAAAIIHEKAKINACPVGGQDLVDRLSNLLGITADAKARQVACVFCQGEKEYAKDKFNYQGIRDCRANAMLQGGSKLCAYGCLGCGTCRDVCSFGAVEMVGGIARIIEEKCTACKACIDICPKHIIELKPFGEETSVRCKSKDSGKVVRGACSVGCIGCRICAKTAPESFVVENNLARFLFDAEHDWELVETAVEKCPTKAIYPGLEKKKRLKAAEEESSKAS